MTIIASIATFAVFLGIYIANRRGDDNDGLD